MNWTSTSSFPILWGENIPKAALFLQTGVGICCAFAFSALLFTASEIPIQRKTSNTSNTTIPVTPTIRPKKQAPPTSFLQKKTNKEPQKHVLPQRKPVPFQTETTQTQTTTLQPKQRKHRPLQSYPIQTTKKRKKQVHCPNLFSVHFGFNKMEPFVWPKKKLSQLTKWLRSHPTAQLMVLGHSDSRGSTSYNLLLSFRRAQAVATFLEKQYKLSFHRMQVQAAAHFGQPTTHRNFGQQRRVSFRLLGAPECSMEPQRKTDHVH